MLLGQALDTRTDLTALGEYRPELVGRFAALRDDLDRVGDDAAHAVPVQAGTADIDADDRVGAARREIQRRRELVDAFDQVIAEIRALPGFAGFLRPHPVGELAAAATGGLVVAVTVSRFGSHALVLTTDGAVEPVPLPGLTPEAVYDRVVDFLDALGGAPSPGAEERVAGTLGWLWDTVAGPVLDRLGITGPPGKGESWPRLWWCPSGLLSFLPLHAAGYHGTRDDPAPATVVDRVVSSYTPTIRALAHARRPRPGNGGSADGAEGRVLAVAMPHTPGAADLSGARAEADEIVKRLPGRVDVLPGQKATHGVVLAALPGARWAHFACHGMADLADPSASNLLLHDHQTRPLRVVDVARLRLDDADLAFLSACETARPGGRLTDEAIQLASAFQLAGYRHVVATLWPVSDWPTRRAVATFYSGLAMTDEYPADGVGAVGAGIAGQPHLGAVGCVVHVCRVPVSRAGQARLACNARPAWAWLGLVGLGEGE